MTEALTSPFIEGSVMRVTLSFEVKTYRETDGTFSAYVVGLPGVFATGVTLEEVKRGLRNVLESHFGNATA